MTPGLHAVQARSAHTATVEAGPHAPHHHAAIVVHGKVPALDLDDDIGSGGGGPDGLVAFHQGLPVHRARVHKELLLGGDGEQALAASDLGSGADGEGMGGGGCVNDGGGRKGRWVGHERVACAHMDASARTAENMHTRCCLGVAASRRFQKGGG